MFLSTARMLPTCHFWNTIMILAGLAIALGLLLLVWSADRFVDGAAAAARHFALSQPPIGTVLLGFGTSAPAMVVSVLAAAQGNPGIALGNAYGSNITNIALILGITAIICPILVPAQVLRRELPTLTLITALAAWQLWDSQISRLDAIVLLAVFAALMAWTIWRSIYRKDPVPEGQSDAMAVVPGMPLGRAIFWLFVGLLILIGSSRLLVWGAITVAHQFGVSDFIIGLTVVAIGTSLPELASSILAARKGEHDIALGNILGSNLFNTLAVVGLAGVIHPLEFGPEILQRDMLVMAALTLSLFVLGYAYRRSGHIGRVKGALLLAAYFAYTAYLIHSTFISTTA